MNWRKTEIHKELIMNLVQNFKKAWKLKTSKTRNTTDVQKWWEDGEEKIHLFHTKQS